MEMITAKINESHYIDKEDLKILITYARWLNDAELYDDDFHVENAENLEEQVIEILFNTFGMSEGYIPGDWLDEYAKDLGIDTYHWKRGCADIELI